MRRICVYNWMIVAAGLGILCLTGCGTDLREAAAAGLFDFVTGTVTDILTQFIPISDAA